MKLFSVFTIMLIFITVISLLTSCLLYHLLIKKNSLIDIDENSSANLETDLLCDSNEETK